MDGDKGPDDEEEEVIETTTMIDIIVPMTVVVVQEQNLRRVDDGDGNKEEKEEIVVVMVRRHLREGTFETQFLRSEYGPNSPSLLSLLLLDFRRPSPSFSSFVFSSPCLSSSDYIFI